MLKLIVCCGILQIKFLGGAGEVGRSGILVHDMKTMLLDYGIKIDGHTEYPLPAGRIDACFVSHAHLDHSGYAPVVYQDGFPDAFATAPTMKLAELLIEDSIKIHKRKHEHERVHKAQLKTMLNKYMPCEYGKGYEFGEYTVSMHDAGHICGSAVTSIEKYRDGKRLVYTGDFKIEKQLLEGGADIVKSDVLLLESTYAGKNHPDREKMAMQMVEEIKETVDNGGIALLPVFAVGRAQEMLALMNKNGLIERTFVDGMAKTATEIVESFPEFIRNEGLLRGAVEKVRKVRDSRNRLNALEGGNIILTTSGMLNGGPVLDYITRLNRHSRIFLTGYQVEDSNGSRLMQGLPLDIDGRKYRVKTPFKVYDFSAHAGKDELHKYVRESGPSTVICVHGSQENTSAFAEELKLEGFNAIAPRQGDVIDIDF